MALVSFMERRQKIPSFPCYRLCKVTKIWHFCLCIQCFYPYNTNTSQNNTSHNYNKLFFPMYSREVPLPCPNTEHISHIQFMFQTPFTTNILFQAFQTVNICFGTFINFRHLDYKRFTIRLKHFLL